MKSPSCLVNTFGLIAVFGLFQADAATLFFEAELNSAQVVDPINGPPDSSATGMASFALTLDGPEGPVLSYDIKLNGLDIVDGPFSLFGGPSQEVNAIHIHFGSAGNNGRHALNLFRIPREDDADLLIFDAEDRVTGRYDNSDENFGADGVRQGFDSIALTESRDPLVDPSDPTSGGSLAALMAGGLYLQVHTYGYGDGEIRGQILPVPEPSVFLLGMAGFISLCFRRSHHFVVTN